MGSGFLFDSDAWGVSVCVSNRSAAAKRDLVFHFPFSLARIATACLYRDVAQDRSYHLPARFVLESSAEGLVGLLESTLNMLRQLQALNSQGVPETQQSRRKMPLAIVFRKLQHVVVDGDIERATKHASARETSDHGCWSLYGCRTAALPRWPGVWADRLRSKMTALFVHDH